MLRAAEAYADLIPSEPTVIMGDFNSNAIWDKRRKLARDHGALVNALAELGLVSSYHHLFGQAHGAETRPTHYFRWHEPEPFHLDTSLRYISGRVLMAVRRYRRLRRSSPSMPSPRS